MFSEVTPEFRVEFEQWRSTRPEWKSLLQAIRAGNSLNEVAELLPTAGASRREIYELILLRDRARTEVERAKAYPAAQKQLNKIDSNLAAAREAAEKGKDAATRAEAAEQAMLLEVDRVQFHLKEVAGAKAAHDIVECAKTAGVI